MTPPLPGGLYFPAMAVELFIEGVEVAAAVWENRTALRRALTRLWNRLRHGNLQIAVFGAGGVGKSTLGQILTGEASADDLPAGYSESLVLEKYPLEGDLVCSLLVPPGQERRREERSRVDLLGSLAAGKSFGVINVVSYGYHSFAELGFEKHKLYRKGMIPKDFMGVYLPERRREEIRVLDALKPYLLTAHARIWMVTLVTKQDLWWAQRAEVNDYYTSGEYAAHLEDIVRQRGAQNFVHRLVSASLLWNNFKDHDGTVLATTTAGYEQSVRAANLKRALNVIHDLCEQQVQT